MRRAGEVCESCDVGFGRGGEGPRSDIRVVEEETRRGRRVYEAALYGFSEDCVRAGFAKNCITPSLGTRMLGFAARDLEKGCEGVHDDLFARCLYAEHDGEECLIVALDLCFVGRSDADRFKGAIGRRLDLRPGQILINASHTHTGAAAGTWAYAAYERLPDPVYIMDLETAIVRSAAQARESACDVGLRAGVAHTTIPMNRRKRDADGKMCMLPNPGGNVYDRLPICVFERPDGAPVCVAFSVSCHPSMVSGWEISAEYPGAATRRIDAALGAEVSMFLQGAGGDAKPGIIGDGERWRVGCWDEMAQVGEQIAGEVLEALPRLTARAPALAAAMTETAFPLQQAPSREKLERIAKETDYDLRRYWAERQLLKLDRYGSLVTHAEITIQGIKLGEDIRCIGVEGELVGDLGHLIAEYYRHGVTMPLGYSNGEGMYIPTSEMINNEGGYEVESYWEYGYPAPLAPGLEALCLHALNDLRMRGID